MDDDFVNRFYQATGINLWALAIAGGLVILIAAAALGSYIAFIDPLLAPDPAPVTAPEPVTANTTSVTASCRGLFVSGSCNTTINQAGAQVPVPAEAAETSGSGEGDTSRFEITLAIGLSMFAFFLIVLFAALNPVGKF